MLLGLTFVDIVNGVFFVAVVIGLIIAAAIYSKRSKSQDSEVRGDETPGKTPVVDDGAHAVFDLPDPETIPSKGTVFDLPDMEPALAEEVPSTVREDLQAEHDQAQDEPSADEPPADGPVQYHQAEATASEVPEAESPEPEHFEITDRDDSLNETRSEEIIDAEVSAVEPIKPVAEVPEAEAAEKTFAETEVAEADVAESNSMPTDEVHELELEADQPAVHVERPPIPPSSRPFVASSKPSPASPTPPQKRPIPPRRPKPEFTPPPPVDEEPDTIEVLADDDHLPSQFLHASADDDVVSELRLALEASHNELSHLSAARDQALSVAQQHEQEISRLGEQFKAAQQQHMALSQEKDSLAEKASQLAQQNTVLNEQLEATRAELSEVRAQLPEAPVEDTIQQIEEQHLATVNELRSILGQREATEASLERERDSLAAQIEDLQRKIDGLAGVSGLDDEVADAPSLERMAELEAAQQQAASELSLANETISQLNQNLSLRDGRLMELQQAHAELEARIAELQDAANVPPNLELEAERDQLRAQLESAQQALTEASEKNSELAESLAARIENVTQLQEEHEQRQADLKNTQASLAAASEKTVQLENELATREASLEQLQAERDQLASERDGKLEELKSALEQQEQHAQGLQAEKKDLIDRLRAMQEEVDARAAEMRRLQDTLQIAQQQADVAAEHAAAWQASEKSRTEIASELAEKSTQLQSLQNEQIDLKQQLASLTDASEAWEAEKRSLYQQMGLDENGEPLDSSSTEAATTEPELNEEALAQIQRLETALSDRDRAFSQLQKRFEQLQEQAAEATSTPSAVDQDTEAALAALTADRDQAAAAAAEASATIAQLMAQLQDAKLASADVAEKVAKLEEENRSYRTSVAELQAVANELEELRLARAREQDNARERLHEATAANAELSAELAELREQAATGATDEPTDELSAENERLQQQLAELQQSAIAIRRDHDQHKSRVAELTDELASIPTDKKEAGRVASESRRLRKTVESQAKKLEVSEARLQDLAAALSKARVEASSLRSELAQQKAVVRALNGGGEFDSLENGRPAKPTRTRKPATGDKAKSKTARKTAQAKKPGRSVVKPKKDRNRGLIFSQPPADIDDLKKISGVGPVLEKRLNAVGIYQFAQVKSWTKSIVDYLDNELSLGGRIARDDWVAQARKLSK